MSKLLGSSASYAVPESPSQSEYHRELAEKYNLEPFGVNNNQWVYEMCARIEEKHAKVTRRVRVWDEERGAHFLRDA